jgi:hypothetical protein
MSGEWDPGSLLSLDQQVARLIPAVHASAKLV